MRVCGASKLTHLLRSHPPGTVAAAAQSYDKALLDAYAALTGLDPLSPEQAAQCQLPVRRGGRGLRSQERLAPAAWVGSWAQCLGEVLARTGLTSLADLNTCALPLATECCNALASLPQLATDANDEVSWQTLAQQPRPRLQKHFSDRLDQKTFADLLNTLDLGGRARLRSCSGPLAGAWQLAFPGRPSERLEDADYRSAARELLGQALAPAGGTTCCNRARTGERQLCGEALCRHAHHAHRCSRGGGLKARSADLERALECIHLECGHAVARQVHVPGWDRYRWHCGTCTLGGTAWDRPGACSNCGGALQTDREEAILDLEVRTARVPKTFFDVTVHHSVPGDAARLASASSCDGAVAKEAEGNKRRRYPDGRTPFRGVPFALESYGRVGETALKHLRELARDRAANLQEGGEEAASALLQRWAASLSSALCRANARSLRSALGAASAKATGKEVAAELAG